MVTTMDQKKSQLRLRLEDLEGTRGQDKMHKVQYRTLLAGLHGGATPSINPLNVYA